MTRKDSVYTLLYSLERPADLCFNRWALHMTLLFLCSYDVFTNIIPMSFPQNQ